ncbi:MAG: hypothetical protein H6Q52_879 [Deltaproteobacteria bacterium]|nr:hypothetical protein [Deltaproteobacteria bacterium]
MILGKNLLLCALVFAVILFFGWDDLTAADPNVEKDVNIDTVSDSRSSDALRTVVKNPHGFLEYDGTGYRIITREPKPDKASQVRLKPVTSKEYGTVYILEVVDEKEKPAEQSRTSAQRPRIAVQRVEDLEKRKGVAPEPVKEHKADFGVGVKVSESSEVLVGRQVVVERKDNNGLDSRDDGWRFRFKTNF